MFRKGTRMKKQIIILLLSGLFLSCSTLQKATNTSNSTNSTSETKQKIETIYETVARDSVVIRDSVVMHPDGSKSSFHSEKTSKIDIQKFYYNIYSNILKTLSINTKTTVYQTKTVYKHDLIWYSGLLFYISLFIIILIKLNKKFSLWQKLTKGS
jgi:hypothetical protein